MPRAKQSPADSEASGLLFPVAPYAGTILDAMHDAGLIGPQWAPWRTFWKAVFALPMDRADRLRFAKHAGGRRIPTEPVSEAWQLIGRRGGKSRNAGLGATFLAIRQDYRTILAPGEKAVIPVIASDHDQALQVVNYIKGLIALPAFQPYVVRELQNSVDFSTGVTVKVATASYRSTRGYTVVGVVADEVAFWRSEDAAEPDREILNALRPGMATIPGALLLVLSTPYARKGELYRAHREYYGHSLKKFLVWNADTLSMHRDAKLKAFIREQFEADPVVAASEYGQDGSVVFRADVESFVEPEAVRAATVPQRFELPKQEGIRYVAFTDPSGGSQDAWALAIAYFDAQRDKAALAALRERMPPFSPAAVVEDYAPLLKAYGITEVEGDHYGGEFPRELFRRHGITYRPADKPKSDLYREWLPMLNAGRLELLDLPRLKTQFCGLERRVERSGKESIDHAPGGHDDLANAAAGALVRVARKRHAATVRFAL